MGYVLTKYDDLRIDGDHWAEARRASAVIHIGEIRFEILYDDIGRLRDVLDVVEDRYNGDPLRDPGEDLVAAYKREDEDAQLLSLYGEIEAEDLERLLVLKTQHEEKP